VSGEGEGEPSEKGEVEKLVVVPRREADVPSTHGLKRRDEKTDFERKAASPFLLSPRVRRFVQTRPHAA